MSHESLYSQKRILILGAGVTGLACAHSLSLRQAQVTVVDDNHSELKATDYEVQATTSVSASDFDYVLISPGWKATHPLIIQAEQEGIPLLNEIDLAWEIRQERSPGQNGLHLQELMARQQQSR